MLCKAYCVPASITVTSPLTSVFCCVTVVTAQDQVCRTDVPITLTSPTGYISSSITMETGRGSQACPWRIEVLPGQRINITLYNFARAGGGEDAGLAERKPKVCYQYAVLREKDYVRAITECEGATRRSIAYVSTSNVVEVNILARKTHEVHFLLHYEGKSPTHAPLTFMLLTV